MKAVWFLLLLVALVGCATPARQTEAFFQTKHEHLPEKKIIPDVPFILQKDGYCGPATLTMAMQWTGKMISVEEIAPLVYTPGMKGSLQTDMISASRRQGLMAIAISGLDPLLTEVAAGHPVIVFENLALTWFPQWHYALVYGFDLPNQKIILHSGPEEAKHWDMSRFERSWMLGDYWGLVILPPGQLSAAGNELSHVTAAAGLEQTGKIEEARLSYEAILKRWPESLGTLIGLGNVSFSRQDFQASVRYLNKAVEAHPDSAVAWHNLAIALGNAHQIRLAQKSAARAVQLAAPESKSSYQANLKDWLIAGVAR